MKSIYPGIFFFLVTSFSFSQNSDSLVYYDELVFNDPVEKEVFKRYHRDPESNIRALLAVAGNSITGEELQSIEKRIDQFIQHIETPKFVKKKPVQKIKIIDKNVRTDFLRIPDQVSYINDLFKTGTYNQITGAALFALVVEELEIPYVIRESFADIRVFPFPEQSGVPVLEAIHLEDYEIEYTPEEKREFINFLLTTEQITEQEAVNIPVDALFEEHFYKEKETTLRGIAGELYYNKSLFLFENNLTTDAFRNAEKAYFLYPEKHHGKQILDCISTLLYGCQYNDIKYAPYLYKAARFKDYGITSKIIEEEFLKLTNQVLISRYDVKLYDEYFTVLSEHITDQVILDEISFIYYYERSRGLQSENKFQEALPLAEKAYRLNPKHMDAKNMFTNCIMNTIRMEEKMENALSSLNEYAIRYPMLKENNAFNDIRIILMMGCCIEEFGKGNYQAGFHHMKEFERTTENKPIISNLLPVNAVIVEAYSLAASYYFRTGQQTKARECLETGLKYVPGNWELQDKMRMLNQ